MGKRERGKRGKGCPQALLFMILLILISLGGVQAESVVLTGQSFTGSGITVANGANADGFFNDTTATTTAWSSGDTGTWLIQDFTQGGTITNVTFVVRMNATGWSGSKPDSFRIEYSNESSPTTWIFAESGLNPPNTLTNSNNYSVFTSFWTSTQVNNMRVRLYYVVNSPTDGVTAGIDGVEVYVTYTPQDTSAPNITLITPGHDTFVTSPNVSFTYYPTDNRDFANCSLFLNGTVNATNVSAIVNGTNNVINVTGLLDGAYAWNVSCIDKSGNRNSSTAYLVKVDTRAPNVTITSPGNNSISASTFNRFWFNVSDFASVTACKLYVDGTERNSYANPPKGINSSTNATLTIGDHLWWINCTDENGWEGESPRWNLSVQVTTPTIVPDSGAYLQGDTVHYTGANWQVGANVVINSTLPNGSNELLYAVANASGKINASHPLNYSAPTGSYTVFAYHVSDPTNNASTSFTVSPLVSTLTTDAGEYIQGEAVTFTGSGFVPFSNVNFTKRYPGGEVSYLLPIADGGAFVWVELIEMTDPPGEWNATAFSVIAPNLNSTAFFTVAPRIPTLIANRTTYGVNESAGFRGRFFSENATVTFTIFNTVTQRTGTGFPSTVFANATGGFNTSWFTNMTCGGNYTALAEDLNVTSYAANTTFRIDHNAAQRIGIVTDSIVANRVAPSLAAVTASDANRQSVGMGGAVYDGYLQFTFHPDLPPNATITKLNVSVQQYRTSNKVNGYQFYFVNTTGAFVASGTGCSGTPTDAETYVTCDLLSFIANSSVANNLTVRVNYTTNNPAGDVLVNHVYLNVSWNGDYYGCTEFGETSVPPDVTAVSVPGEAVILNAGTTREVECNVTVHDNNGVADILGANATFFASPSTSFSPLTNVSKYENSSCATIGATLVTKTFRCTTMLLYYATNGSWTCNATGISIDGTAWRNGTFVVDPLYAINVSLPAIDFGDLASGNTSANISVPSQNFGNQRINVSVYGYGKNPGDNASLSCATTNFSYSALRYSWNVSAGYEAKQNLSAVPNATGIFITPQTTPTITENQTYWQVAIPPGFPDLGACNGTVIFQAELG